MFRASSCPENQHRYTASGTRGFAERLIVETTETPWSGPAEKMLRDQQIPVTRIGLRDLRDSAVDWTAFEGTGEVRRPEPKTLRPDQLAALDAVRGGLEAADRGKLIMACGTGKTLTGLRIAEELAGPGGYVLFLMPSLALVAQSVREWCADALIPLTTFAVCSDTKVGSLRRSTLPFRIRAGRGERHPFRLPCDCTGHGRRPCQRVGAETSSDGASELVLDDAAKIVGCWKALAKAGLKLGTADHAAPMRRALAFCSTIRKSRLIRDEFEQVVAEYRADAMQDDEAARLQ